MSGLMSLFVRFIMNDLGYENWDNVPQGCKRVVGGHSFKREINDVSD